MWDFSELSNLFSGVVKKDYSLSSNAWQALQGGATIGSMISEARAGKEKAANLLLQAQDQEMEIQSEVVNGMRRRAGLRDALAATLGERTTAAAASGIDSTFGTPAEMSKQITQEADRAASDDQAVQRARVARLEERKTNLGIQARSAKKDGERQALVRGVSGLASAFNRGVPPKTDF